LGDTTQQTPRHAHRWGYGTLDALAAVVGNYSASALPLETIWSDIDYMAGRYRNAEMDPVRFPAASMTSFLDRLAERGQHWIPIIDAGVAKSDGYVVAAEGDAADIWIKDVYGAPYVGQGAYLLYLSSLSLQPYLSCFAIAILALLAHPCS
jgi:alpha-glucosidase